MPAFQWFVFEHATRESRFLIFGNLPAARNQYDCVPTGLAQP
jgi:hypothetical protein